MQAYLLSEAPMDRGYLPHGTNNPAVGPQIQGAVICLPVTSYPRFRRMPKKDSEKWVFRPMALVLGRRKLIESGRHSAFVFPFFPWRESNPFIRSSHLC